MRYADVELFWESEDLASSKAKPYKRLFDLDNGRFEFTFLNRSSKAYKIRVSKHNRETSVIQIPEDRPKSYELPYAIILKENTSLPSNDVK